MSDTPNNNVIEFPSMSDKPPYLQNDGLQAAMERHPSSQAVPATIPVTSSANGIITGGTLAVMNDTAILVVQVEIGDGQTVMAGLGAEAVNNLLAAVGQRNGLVSVTYDPETMSGVTFAPRPIRV